MSDLVQYEMKQSVAVITLNNPPVYALGSAVADAIRTYVAKADEDAAVQAIVLIGSGSMEKNSQWTIRGS